MLGQRIVPALDAAARLALFSTCHALARLVLQHAPGTKRLTCKMMANRAPTLAHLLGTAWQPLPRLSNLELTLTAFLVAAAPPAISQHVSHLHLRSCTISARDLTGWRLDDATLWPHLQHLTVDSCNLIEQPGAARPAAEPIPRLQRFAWTDAGVTALHAGPVDALLSLAVLATHARLHLHDATASARVLRRMPSLTHAHMAMEAGVVEALLQHASLEHVTLTRGEQGPLDLSRRPCRWKTLTLSGGAHLHELALLPLGGLERLTIDSWLSMWVAGARQWLQREEAAQGLAALERLHAAGKLAFAPCGAAERRDALAPRPGGGLFLLPGVRPALLARVLRLVLEAGRGGITALQPDAQQLPLECLRGEVAPLLERHGGAVQTLSVRGWPDDEWCLAALGALPAGVGHVQLMNLEARHVRALVKGALASLRHPIRLTLLHHRRVREELKAELRRTMALHTGPQLLTLEFVHLA